jgi:hypothetical protein
MSKRKRTKPETTKSETTKSETTKSETTKADVDILDQAEEILIQLLNHASNTTTFLESVLSGKKTEINEEDISTRQKQFSTKMLKLHNLLTQEYRRSTANSSNKPPTQSKQVLSKLDKRLEKQKNQFFS